MTASTQTTRPAASTPPPRLDPLARGTVLALMVAMLLHGSAILTELGAQPGSDDDASFILIGIALYFCCCLAVMTPALVLAAVSTGRGRIARARLDWSITGYALLCGVGGFVGGRRSPDPAVGLYSGGALLLLVASLTVAGLPLVLQLARSPRRDPARRRQSARPDSIA